jgi:hypothetical protein
MCRLRFPHENQPVPLGAADGAAHVRTVALCRGAWDTKGVLVYRGRYYGWSAAMAEKDAFSTILNILCTWTNDKSQGLEITSKDTGDLASKIRDALVTDGHLQPADKAD